MATAPQTAPASAAMPDMKVSVRQLFSIDSDMEVPAYSKADDYVPDVDPKFGVHVGKPERGINAVAEIASVQTGDMVTCLFETGHHRRPDIAEVTGD